jgi:hypothetical protein
VDKWATRCCELSERISGRAANAWLSRVCFSSLGRSQKSRRSFDLEVLVARQIEELRQTVFGGVGQRFRVNQILALVLQFDVGPHGINIQSDARFLKFGGLLVESLSERDTSISGVASCQGAKNEQVLVHNGGDHVFGVVSSSARDWRVPSRPIW